MTDFVTMVTTAEQTAAMTAKLRQLDWEVIGLSSLGWHRAAPGSARREQFCAILNEACTLSSQMRKLGLPAEVDADLRQRFL